MSYVISPAGQYSVRPAAKAHMHTVSFMKRSNMVQATRLGDVCRRYEYEWDTDMDIKDKTSLKGTNPSERNIDSYHGSPVPCLAKYVHGWGGVDWNWISRPGFLKLPYLTLPMIGPSLGS